MFVCVCVCVFTYLCAWKLKFVFYGWLTYKILCSLNEKHLFVICMCRWNFPNSDRPFWNSDTKNNPTVDSIFVITLDLAIWYQYLAALFCFWILFEKKDFLFSSLYISKMFPLVCVYFFNLKTWNIYTKYFHLRTYVARFEPSTLI